MREIPRGAAVLFYWIAYLVLIGFHLLAVSYPEGAWSDDWLAYYASSARFISKTGPTEMGRRIMVDAFAPESGTVREREVAKIQFNTAHPYIGWSFLHSSLLRLTGVSLDTAFLILQLAGCLLYLLAVKTFARACFSELDAVSAGRQSWGPWILPLIVLLQISYIGNLRFIGPAIFLPVVYILPLVFLFLGLLSRPSYWALRVALLGGMLLLHNGGLVFAGMCLVASFLYCAAGGGRSSLPAYLRFRIFFRETLAVVLLFLLLVTAAKLDWMPSLFPFWFFSDFRLGLALQGAHRAWRVAGVGFLAAALIVIPFFLVRWRQIRGTASPLPLVIIVWLTVGMFSVVMLFLEQTWTKFQAPLVRFLYVGWPVFLASVLVASVWLLAMPNLKRYAGVLLSFATLMIVVNNVRGDVYLYRAMSKWRDSNNCKFLFEPVKSQIEGLSKMPGGFVTLFSAAAGGYMSFIAGAGDHPVLYTALTPDWQERINGFFRPFVFIVAPARPYFSGGNTVNPAQAPELPGDQWVRVSDKLVSRKGTVALPAGASLTTVADSTKRLVHPGWGCESLAESVYRLMVYQKMP